MTGVYLGVSVRVLVDLESLNMAESVGNVTKHRKAPVVVPHEGGYRLVYVPVVSGMSLAHHYQRLLAQYASKMGLPVTKMSLEGYFLKFSDDNIIKKYYPEVAKKWKKGDACSNEKTIVEACTVADVGGFLYTSKPPVKRTSRFSFTYMMPALDAIKRGAVGVYPQIHVRYTPEAGKGEQSLLYMDNASALYTMAFMLEADKISYLDMCSAIEQKPVSLGKEERLRRYQASIRALIGMLANMYFGAKRSRSMPHWRVESLVAIANTGIAPLTPSPGHGTDYIVTTVLRAEQQKQAGVIDDYKIVYYIDNELGTTVSKPNQGEQANSVENALFTIAKWAEEKLK